MNYKLNLGAWNTVFAVPSAITDQYIKLCSGVALKALLLMLRHSEHGISTAEIAELLSLSQGDVCDAVNSLVQLGIVQLAGEELTLAVKEKQDDTTSIRATAKTAVVSAPSAIPLSSEATAAPKPEIQEIPVPHGGEQKLVKVTGTKSSLSRGEMHQLISSNSRLENLIHETQQVMGKTLTSAEMDTIVSLHSYYGLTCDFILMAIQYCCSIQKANMRYIEKTIAAWVDLGVDTHEKAEKHIAKLADYHSKENKVRSAFGISDRALISKEQKMIETWFDDYHFDIAMMKLAFERTVEKTGKLSFAYINTILSSWHSKGIKTPKDAAMEQAPSYDKQGQGQKPAEGTAPAPKHAPSRKASYDIDELEKMIYSGYGEEKKD